jgi:hypothetical protein
MTSDELGFDTVHKPGALTRYFAERWLEEPSAEGEQLIAWLLESALGRNALYFIEKTKEYVDAWGGRGEIVPENAFDGFVITGDPVEEAIIPHAMLVWTCMNDRPWSEEVYHRWLDTLLAAGSAEAAYLAASLWPAHDLMAKVTYRPPGWLVYRGQLDAEAERLILVEMLKGASEPTTSLYGPFEYDDDVTYLKKLPQQYIKKHGFTHPICGLVNPIALKSDSDLMDRIRAMLAMPSWSEGVKDAVMLLYLSSSEFNNKPACPTFVMKFLEIIEQNLFKLDKKHIDIINFHKGEIDEIDYNLIKDYINYLIILHNRVINGGRSHLSIKTFSKYISIGLKTKDILYIGKEFGNVIFNLMRTEKEKVESWLEKQVDDSRIKDILLPVYMTGMNDYMMIDKELNIEQLEKKIEDIYGKITYVDKIRLLIDQAKKYFNISNNKYKIFDFIDDILEREVGVNFSCNFREDYVKIISSWHPNRWYFSEKYMFFKSNHIGLHLYYNILQGWEGKIMGIIVNEGKEAKVYTDTKWKMIENLYGHKTDSIKIRLASYLNKIEYNNFPCEELKNKFINEFLNFMKENRNEILKYLKHESKLKVAISLQNMMTY